MIIVIMMISGSAVGSPLIYSPRDICLIIVGVLRLVDRRLYRAILLMQRWYSIYKNTMNQRRCMFARDESPIKIVIYTESSVSIDFRRGFMERESEW